MDQNTCPKIWHNGIYIYIHGNMHVPIYMFHMEKCRLVFLSNSEIISERCKLFVESSNITAHMLHHNSPQVSEAVTGMHDKIVEKIFTSRKKTLILQDQPWLCSSVTFEDCSWSSRVIKAQILCMTVHCWSHPFACSIVAVKPLWVYLSQNNPSFERECEWQGQKQLLHIHAWVAWLFVESDGWLGESSR